MKAPMEIMGEQARKGIDNFMKAFPDYKIENVVADIEVKPTKIKGRLQIKMKKKPKVEKGNGQDTR